MPGTTVFFTPLWRIFTLDTCTVQCMSSFKKKYTVTNTCTHLAIASLSN